MNEILDAYYRLNILRELLTKSTTYDWENIIRGVLDIPKEEQTDA